MKVGILTFHRPANYGAVLQAYGLLTVLQRLGHEAYVIDYSQDYILRLYKAVRIKSFGQWFRLALHPRTFIHEIMCTYKRSRRNRAFADFRRRKLRLIQPEETDMMDALVVGSDQVWNMEMTGGDKSYFLPDAGFGQLKIAYAASAGQCTSLETTLCGDILRLISEFDAVSVRETSLGTFLKGRLHMDFPTVLDPTLLAGREVFQNLVSRRYIPKKKYLLSFSLTKSDVQESFARVVAREAGIPHVITLVGMNEFRENRDKVCKAEVEQFVSLVAGASFVVTSSFHGTAFSILFRKPFITVGRSESHVSRMKSLLEMLGLSGNLVYEAELSDRPESIVGGYLPVLQSIMCQSAERFLRKEKNPWNFFNLH